MRHSKVFQLVGLVLITFLAFACEKDEVSISKSQELEGFDFLTSYEKITTKTKSDLLKSYDGEVDADDVNAVHNYDIDIYKITYDTQDYKGQDITASGIVVVPKNSTETFNLIGYLHGTVNPIGDESGAHYYPSKFNYDAWENFEPLIMSAFAMNGNIVVAPDYIGYGSSEDSFHPYNIYSALAEDSETMFKAALEFLEAENIKNSGEFRLTGWSEGAAAGMALVKKVESEGSELTITAASFMAGAYSNYDLAKELALANEERYPVAVYTRTFLAYDEFFGVDRSLDYYLQQEYVADFETTYFPYSAFGVNPSDLWHTNLVDAIITESDPLAQAFQAEELTDFAPQMPVYIMAGDEDAWVPYSQTVNAYDRMSALGGNIEMTIFEGEGHGFDAYIPVTLGFFAEN